MIPVLVGTDEGMGEWIMLHMGSSAPAWLKI